RKGTALVLEQLTHDVTGWGAHAVQFFKLLAATQNMNHRRLDNTSAELRRWQVCDYIDSGFDVTAHTLDVRRISLQRGRNNIPNIGIFLWTLTAFPVKSAAGGIDYAPAAPVPQNPQCFRCNPLGRDMPLFNHPIPVPTNSETPSQLKNVADR